MAERRAADGDHERPFRLAPEAPIGVLGLGSIGLRHARNLLALGRQVVGYDPSAERRDMLRQIGGHSMESRTALLEQSAALVIASPNEHHLTDMEEAIAMGRPIFVEKPLAHEVDGAKRVLDRADAEGLIVFVGLNLRFHPAVRAARKILERDGLGAVLWARLISASYLPDWRPHQDHRTGYAAVAATGGVLFDLIHEFDLAIHLLGPARTVCAVARNSGTLDIPSEDCADVVLAHSSGPQSALHLDYVTRPRRRVTEIVGTGGSMEIDLFDRRLRIFSVDGTLLTDETFPGGFDDDYVAEMRSFLACLEGVGLPPCDGREALSVLRQVILARQLAALPS